MSPQQRPQKSFLVLAGEYTTLAFVLPATTFTGWLVGYLLDQWLGTGYLKIIFLLLGIAGGFIHLIRRFLKDMRDSGE